MMVLAELTATDWMEAGIIAGSTIVLAWATRRFTKRTIRRRERKKGHSQAEIIDLVGRLLVVVIMAIGTYYTLRALDIAIGPLLGAFGIGTLLVAFGLQSLLVNMVSSVVLYARRPFRRGDQVVTNGHEGTVIDITSMSTVLLSFDGHLIHIPNADVLTTPLVNWTHEDVRRTVVKIDLPYGCEVEKALATMGRAARQILNDENLPPADAIATGFGTNGITTELRFWHYSEYLSAQFALTQVITAVNTALVDIGVKVPFSQVTLHQPDE